MSTFIYYIFFKQTHLSIAQLFIYFTQEILNFKQKCYMFNLLCTQKCLWFLGNPHPPKWLRGLCMVPYTWQSRAKNLGFAPPPEKNMSTRMWVKLYMYI